MITPQDYNKKRFHCIIGDFRISVSAFLLLAPTHSGCLPPSPISDISCPFHDYSSLLCSCNKRWARFSKGEEENKVRLCRGKAEVNTHLWKIKTLHASLLIQNLSSCSRAPLGSPGCVSTNCSAVSVGDGGEGEALLQGNPIPPGICFGGNWEGFPG